MKKTSPKQATPTTISNCHVEQGTTHLHHDEHTVRAVASIADALRANADALGVLARAITVADRERSSVTGHGIHIGG